MSIQTTLGPLRFMLDDTTRRAIYWPSGLLAKISAHYRDVRRAFETWSGLLYSASNLSLSPSLQPGINHFKRSLFPVFGGAKFWSLYQRNGNAPGIKHLKKGTRLLLVGTTLALALIFARDPIRIVSQREDKRKGYGNWYQ